MSRVPALPPPEAAAAATGACPALDDFDRHLLAFVQQDCTLSAEHMGAAIGLSASAVQRRLKRLRAQGVIQAQVAVLDPARVGRGVTLLAGLQIDRDNYPVLAALRPRLAQDAAVQQAWYVTGQNDLMVVVQVANMAAYDAWCAALMQALPQIGRITTQVVIESLKRGLVVPVEAPV
ncbi:Lrp/AsnC family transcriptional regulator [Ideonella livida]|uniref:Lrp/AsnC family transcriptional regulator n=1 Tax=Ideonella livida TaxID=2707176 RepID=A0A7C9TP56_9BURK|nr:Lrp/AsnC family transcriptional regulator [Ideonella livida]NDY93306.1 Lrp/AsnC family transcriptional regulator [Ideonella livida]